MSPIKFTISDKMILDGEEERLLLSVLNYFLRIL